MRKELVTLTDDLDGSEEGVRTYQFSWDDRDLEIDLSRENYLQMQAVMRRYIAVARPAGRSRPVRRTITDRNRAANIRRWARENGVAIDDRGRIPAHVIARWEKETGK